MSVLNSLLRKSANTNLSVIELIYFDQGGMTWCQGLSICWFICVQDNSKVNKDLGYIGHGTSDKILVMIQIQMWIMVLLKLYDKTIYHITHKDCQKFGQV